MNSVKNTGIKFLILVIVFLAALNFTSCSKNPVSANGGAKISGNWEGAFNHPDYYSGYLTMMLNQSGNSISGTYHLAFYYGYSDGPKYDGNVTGTVSQSGKYDISLLNNDFTYNCSLTLDADTLNGNWVSKTNSKSGSLSVHKN